MVYDENLSLTDVYLSLTHRSQFPTCVKLENTLDQKFDQSDKLSLIKSRIKNIYEPDKNPRISEFKKNIAEAEQKIQIIKNSMIQTNNNRIKINQKEIDELN